MKNVIIGDCTLYLGDCREFMTNKGGLDTMVTDPPFGMSFVSGHRRGDTAHMPIQNDNTPEMLRWATEQPTRHSSYIFCRWDNLTDVRKPKSCITWVKNNHSMGDLEHEHARMTEICLFYEGAEHRFPRRRPTDVIYADRTGNEYHPTEKPVDLMTQIIPWTAGTVFDPFMGSGTTAVACAKIGRSFIGVEIEEKYFDIACMRVSAQYAQPDMFGGAA